MRLLPVLAINLLVVILQSSSSGAEGQQIRLLSISPGQDHTCALTTEHDLYCWGANGDGQLGLGQADGNLHTLPVMVPLPVKFKFVTSGYRHTCGLTASGEAYCWGWNEYGQLGNGTRTQSSRPAKVTSSITFKALSAGATHTCGISEDGTSYCWGGNWHGQLGVGSFDGEPGASCCRTAPAQVAGPTKFAQISAGGIHTCGLSTTGEVFCWGNENDGRLGVGSLEKRDRPSPAAVIGSLRFSSVSARGWHSCGLARSGAVYCWGSDSDGQLGDGRAGLISPDPVRSASEQVFREVSVGSIHTCAIAQDGHAYCWGSNKFGQLGVGSLVSKAAPEAIAMQQTFRSIVAGGNEFSGHTCAIAADEKAYCWGDNRHGQLGDGTTNAGPLPRQVLLPR